MAPPVVATVQIQLLGDFNFTCDGAPVEGITTPRLQSLIAYLLLHRDAPHLRQQLAFLFWPDSNEMQARNNLRQLLHSLRRTQPDISAFLMVDSRALQWRSDVSLRLDVEEFEQALAVIERGEREHDASAFVGAGERLLEIHQADLLPGCYDEWIAPERERLRERFVQALGRLIEFYEAQHNFTAAIRCARRVIRADPLNRLDRL